MKFEGQTAIVTGASRGIGRAAALALVRGGARVVVHGSRPESLAPVAKEIAAAGGVALPVSAMAGAVIRASIIRAVGCDRIISVLPVIRIGRGHCREV